MPIQEWILWSLPSALAVAFAWSWMRAGARSRATVVASAALVAIVLAIVAGAVWAKPRSAHAVWGLSIAMLTGVGPLAAVGSAVATARVSERWRNLLLIVGLLLVVVSAPLFVVVGAGAALVTVGEGWRSTTYQELQRH
jgi:hypothetical protein